MAPGTGIGITHFAVVAALIPILPCVQITSGNGDVDLAVGVRLPGVSRAVKIQAGNLLHQRNYYIGDFLQISPDIDARADVINEGAGVDGDILCGDIVCGRENTGMALALFPADIFRAVFVAAQATFIAYADAGGVMALAFFLADRFLAGQGQAKPAAFTNVFAAVGSRAADAAQQQDKAQQEGNDSFQSKTLLFLGFCIIYTMQPKTFQ